MAFLLVFLADGTGALVLKFHMILKNLALIQEEDRPVYWLLETTASLKFTFRQQISNLFAVDIYFLVFILQYRMLVSL